MGRSINRVGVRLSQQANHFPTSLKLIVIVFPGTDWGCPLPPRAGLFTVLSSTFQECGPLVDRVGVCLKGRLAKTTAASCTLVLAAPTRIWPSIPSSSLQYKITHSLDAESKRMRFSSRLSVCESAGGRAVLHQIDPPQPQPSDEVSFAYVPLSDELRVELRVHARKNAPVGYSGSCTVVIELFPVIVCCPSLDLRLQDAKLQIVSRFVPSAPDYRGLPLDGPDDSALSIPDASFASNGYIFQLPGPGRVFQPEEVAADFDSRVWGCLGRKSVRDMPLALLLLRLANRRGTSFPLAIVGGTVRDLITGEIPNDIDIAVGGSMQELEFCLRETFCSSNQSLTEQDLVGSKRNAVNRRFGQLKIMNAARPKYPCVHSLL